MDLLHKLTVTPGVPGREDRIRQVILQETAGLFDHTQTDALGNLICHRAPRGRSGRLRMSNASSADVPADSTPPTKVLVTAHMDQIGFLVRHIDDKGFLRIQNVGGFDTRNLFARLVTVTTSSGELTGMLNPGGKPVHMASDEERKKIPEITDLIVDLGLPAAQVKQRVRIGDMVTLRAEFHRIGNFVVSQCLDNRIACWIAIAAVRMLEQHDADVWVAFTTQEEVGCRGAAPAADQVKPDVAINLDVTLCCDTPGVPDDLAITRAGEGAGLMVMDSSVISDLGLLERFEKLAEQRSIRAQRTILPRGGTDASAVQKANAGYRVFNLVCPTRYIHTVIEMASLDDLHACRDLLAAYLETA